VSTGVGAGAAAAFALASAAASLRLLSQRSAASELGLLLLGGLGRGRAGGTGVACATSAFCGACIACGSPVLSAVDAASGAVTRKSRDAGDAPVEKIQRRSRPLSGTRTSPHWRQASWSCSSAVPQLAQGGVAGGSVGVVSSGSGS